MDLKNILVNSESCIVAAWITAAFTALEMIRVLATVPTEAVAGSTDVFPHNGIAWFRCHNGVFTEWVARSSSALSGPSGKIRTDGRDFDILDVAGVHNNTVSVPTSNMQAATRWNETAWRMVTRRREFHVPPRRHRVDPLTYHGG